MDRREALRLMALGTGSFLLNGCNYAEAAGKIKKSKSTFEEAERIRRSKLPLQPTTRSVASSQPESGRAREKQEEILQDYSGKKVVLCFDCGTQDDHKYRESIDFAHELEDMTGKKVRFTYFLNTAFLLTQVQGSNIGHANSESEIEKRASLIQEAIDNGHEIGCHTVRHPHGGNFSVEQWKTEILEFDEHVSKFFRDENGKQYRCLGFRAPYLEYSGNLYPALEELGYEYDVSPPGETITKKNGIQVIGIPFYQAGSKRVLGMDYNLQVNGVNGAQLRAMFENESKKQTTIISFHLQNYGVGGVRYFDVAKQFMKEQAKKGARFDSMLEHARSLEKVVKVSV